VILLIEADHSRVGAALLDLEVAIIKAKLLRNYPEAFRKLPVVVRAMRMQFCIAASAPL
jgi:hypothetical protein